MSFEYELIIWAAVFIVSIIVELISLGLTSIWFAGGAVISAIISCCGGPIWLQILAFFVISVGLLIATRPIAKKYVNAKTQKTNVESLVGQKVAVTSTIDNKNATGQVKINDIEWRAKNVDDEIIPIGTEVTIKEVSGVKLIVSK